MTVRPASVPTSTFECPFCDAFPFDTSSAMGEHVATVHVPTGDLTVRTAAPAAAPVPTGSGRFETVENGFGGTTTRRISTPARGDLATEKQVAYALSLAETRLAVDGRGRDDEGKSIVEVLGPALSGSDDRSKWLPALREHFESMTRRSISTSIDGFRSASKVAARPSTSASSTPMQDLSAGLYRVGETIYKVQAAKGSGNLYAKRLSGNADDGFVYEYEAGAIRSVRSEGVRLTVEEAKAFGRRTGTCCVCAAVLTNPESIALGIGPICGGRI